MKHWDLVALSILTGILLVPGCAGSKPGQRTIPLRVMTYNIHHAEGVDGIVDIRRIADHIIASNADIVALQEVDRRVDRSGAIDMMTELSDLTGMTYAFGKTIKFGGGDYGNGVLTSFPIIEERNHLYTKTGTGEQRGLLQLVIEAHGLEITVMNTHLDHRDEAERLSQVSEIRQAATRHAARSIILCADFNDEPGSATHSALKEAFFDTWEQAGSGQGLTYPSTGPTKRIDGVFLGRTGGSAGALRPVSGRTIPSGASDHLPVLMEFEFVVQ